MPHPIFILMYMPPENQEQNRQRLFGVMREHPFGLVISGGIEGGIPYATPVPLLTLERGGEVVLRWHLARNNPQAASLAGREGLAVFQGPHALIDPAWYVSAPQVGTWNYVMVQASGPVSLLGDAEALEVARSLTRTLTPDAPTIPPEFEAKMLRGVVTFELAVTRLEGTFKLSQNKNRADRAAVRGQLRTSGREDDRAMAELIAE